jgi:hypothetical protein
VAHGKSSGGVCNKPISNLKKHEQTLQNDKASALVMF